MNDVVLCLEADGSVALELIHHESIHAANLTSQVSTSLANGWNAERDHTGSCLDVPIFVSEEDDSHTYTKNISYKNHLSAPVTLVAFSSGLFEPTYKNTILPFSPRNNSTLSLLRTLIIQV